MNESRVKNEKYKNKTFSVKDISKVESEKLFRFVQEGNFPPVENDFLSSA